MSAGPDATLTALDALSPVDGRYRAGHRALRAWLSEAGLIRERIRIEAQWLLHLAAAAPQLSGAQLTAAVLSAPRQLAREPDEAPPRQRSRRSRRASTTTSRRSSTTCASSWPAAGAITGDAGTGALRLHLRGHQQL